MSHEEHVHVTEEIDITVSDSEKEAPPAGTLNTGDDSAQGESTDAENAAGSAEEATATQEQVSDGGSDAQTAEEAGNAEAGESGASDATDSTTTASETE